MDGLFVSQILAASFPAARKTILGKHLFYTPALNRLLTNGGLSVAPLGPTVTGHDGKAYDVEEISIPIIWEFSDDLLSEEDKVALITRLLTNAFTHLDDLLLSEVAVHGSGIVSKELRYYLGDITVIPHPPRHMVKVFTVVAVPRVG